jgi:8-oxo-dGTP pyrophosphatase MutT (NUDIX family)
VLIFTMGFALTPDFSGVYLMRKNHPDWQAGLLNGWGGKQNPGESLFACMQRESQEEAGYVANWTTVADIRSHNYPHGTPEFFCRVFASIADPRCGHSPHHGERAD